MEGLSYQRIQDGAQPDTTSGDILIMQDTNRILNCLRGGPMTSIEMACTLHLTMNRIQSILNELAAQRSIYARRWVTDASDNQIPLWELEDADSIA